MALLTRIQQDLLQLRKDGSDKLAISLLTTLYSEAANIGINDGKRQSTDDEVITVIKKFIKGINECLSYSADNQQYLSEKSILEQYLPSQMSEDDLKNAIEVFLASCGVKSKSEIMKYLKSAYSGRYDGKTAVSVIDSILG
jgi:uncharacterized protein YqeY